MDSYEALIEIKQDKTKQQLVLRNTTTSAACGWAAAGVVAAHNCGSFGGSSRMGYEG